MAERIASRGPAQSAPEPPRPSGRLTRVWPPTRPAPALLPYIPASPATEASTGAPTPYVAYLSALIGRSPTYIPAGPAGAPGWRLEAAEAGPLLVAEGIDARDLSRAVRGRLARFRQGGILMAPQPRWPLRQLLLLLEVNGRDLAAVDWAGQLAAAAGAGLTLLALAPAPVYGPGYRRQAGMDVLLSPISAPGTQLRTLAEAVAAWQPAAVLHLRSGEPGWQVRWEVADLDPDLVVMAAGAPARGRRLYMGCMATGLLGWLRHPLLIAGDRPGAVGRGSARE